MSTDSSLLKKYDVPGPRYTSYPTVPYWSDSPTQAQWIHEIAAALDLNEKNNIGSAVYVHVPFCRSLCTYCGCNTRIARSNAVGLPYIETVLKEWDLYLEALGGRRILLKELHLGGGTPTFLSASELEYLIEGILSRSRIADHPELSIEADPRTTSEDQLRTLSKLGFKRLSLGIQDFDPRVQEIVHRVQSEEQVRQVTETARQLGFTGVNYDLIYGLPLQTQQSVQQTIEAVRRLRPDRIAFYAYAHVPWIKPGQRRFTEEDLPSGDEKRALYELGRRQLEESGYREVGMDHFALETDALWQSACNGKLHRNFMGYTPELVAPQFGLGVSSIGDAWTAFAQNEKLLESYTTRVERGELPLLRGHLLNEEDRILRKHVLNVMTTFGTDWSSPELQTPYLQSVPEKLAEFARDGLVELTASSCRVTDKGRPFLRNICMAFDARLSRQAPKTQLFSRTV
ncbi:MAG: oxygen-independent coproporphyrinogen III oxidase [Bdellovibrionales bacterium GWB1_55_8]|nr:MAG: oxygen-independent coproporphyrinogen III oxidase [Bdellovibrionales bacterium GWB1_55_8]